MALFSERKRLADIEALEAEGESFWTDRVPQEARVKIAHAYAWVIDDRFPYNDLSDKASVTFCRDLGLDHIHIDYDKLRKMANTDHFLSFVEAAHHVFSQHDPETGEFFAEEINRVFTIHRVAYKFIPEGSQFIELESYEMHTAVVEPAIKLLYGDPKLDKAQSAYMAALKQISQHDPGNAITDAATALQETFKAMGADGPTLGDQVKAAKKNNLLPGRDSPLLEAVEKAMNWVASERNQNSDAHKVTDATLDDAWLIVHVVGALIVRLAGTPRS